MKELLNAEKSLSARIKVKGNKINSSLKKYKVTIADIDSITLELEIEIEETEKEIYNENQSLIELKNNMANIENQIIKINDKIAELFPYTVQEEKSIAKQCNKFLSKDENGNFEPKLKFSDYRFVLDILEPFKEEIYDIFTIENNDAIYKHNLYFILFLLIKMYGEKSVNTMVNIDEAQDISVNEYELIRKANINSIFNLYGDTNQLLFKNRGIEKWELLGNYNLKGFKLNINYRNVSSITKYCNENLSPLSMEAMGVEGDPVNEISINNINDFIENRCYIIVKDKTILDKLRIRQEYNFIEKKDDNISDTMLNIMTVEMAKGMEFSNVIVVDIGMNKREKYVAYTRALNKLIVAR
jgi:DNA helicase IV